MFTLSAEIEILFLFHIFKLSFSNSLRCSTKVGMRCSSDGWHMEHLSEVLSVVYSHTDRMHNDLILNFICVQPYISHGDTCTRIELLTPLSHVLFDVKPGSKVAFHVRRIKSPNHLRVKCDVWTRSKVWVALGKSFYLCRPKNGKNLKPQPERKTFRKKRRVALVGENCQ